MTLLTMIIVAAGILFPALFILANLAIIDFWWGMTGILVSLIAAITWQDKDWVKAQLIDWKIDTVKKIIFGLAAAVVLYLVFWIGNVLIHLIIPALTDDIKLVYGYKSTASVIRIASLMLFVIGPGEEILWRGFIQRKLHHSLGPWTGFIITTIIYSAVHISSGNPVLVLAAAICGIFWGLLYLRYQSVLLNIVSHTIWDIAVFLILPF